MQTGGRRPRRPRVRRVAGLVRLGVGGGLVDVRRQRRLSGGRALEPQLPPALAEWLDQLDRAQPLPGAQLPRGAREPLPRAVRAESFDEEHLPLPPPPALEPQPGPPATPAPPPPPPARPPPP